MNVEEMIATIQRMDPKDQVLIASRVLDELCLSGRFPLSDEAKAEPDRREQELLANPSRGQTWEEVQKELGWSNSSDGEEADER